MAVCKIPILQPPDVEGTRVAYCNKSDAYCQYVTKGKVGKKGEVRQMMVIQALIQAEKGGWVWV